MTDATPHKTTGEVLARFQRLGLYVTPTMIEDDTRADYLPRRDTVFRGRAGASGLWEPWIEQRAERLYRLRALDRRSGHGPSGNVLRLFLFLADGWGWEYVRDTCIQGYRVAVRHATRGAKNRLRGKPLTLQNLPSVADDIAQEQYKPQDPNQEQIDRVKMTLGLVSLGAAPDDRMGTMEWVTADLVPEADASTLAELKQTGPLLWSMLAVSERDAITILQGDIAPEIIQRALNNATAFLRRVRSLLRRKAGPQKVKGKRPSLNPLTFFGAATDHRFHKMLRQMPIRATPAQYLGGQVAHALIIAYREEQVAKIYEFWLKWFAYWINTEECAEWMRQMESETK